MTTSSHLYQQPVVVKERPRQPKDMSPTTARGVHFPSQSAIVTGMTRPLTPTEAWALYYFEMHARGCQQCYNPYKVLRSHGRLCREGQALAQDVFVHVRSVNGQICAAKPDAGSRHPVNVEVPTGYAHLRALVKAWAKTDTRKPYHEPIINHVPAPAMVLRGSHDLTRDEHRRREKAYDRGAADIIVERARGRDKKSSDEKTRRHQYTVAAADLLAKANEQRSRGRDSERRDDRYTRFRSDSAVAMPECKTYRTEIRRPDWATGELRRGHWP